MDHIHIVRDECLNNTIIEAMWLIFPLFTIKLTEDKITVLCGHNLQEIVRHIWKLVQGSMQIK